MKNEISDPSSGVSGRVEKIIREYGQRKWGLIPLLQRVQEEIGYIPKEAVEPIAESLRLFPSQVQGVITSIPNFPPNRGGGTSSGYAGEPPAMCGGEGRFSRWCSKTWEFRRARPPRI